MIVKTFSHGRTAYHNNPGYTKKVEKILRNIFIYENKFIHSRVETFNLNIFKS